MAVKTDQGVFLSWRMLVSEVCGFSEEAGGMTGVNYRIYRNGRAISLVTNSTNYADVHGTCGDVYAVAPVHDGEEGAACEPVAYGNGSTWIFLFRSRRTLDAAGREVYVFSQ